MGTGYQTNSYTLVWKHSNLKYAVPCIGLVLMSAKKYKVISDRLVRVKRDGCPA